MQRLSYHLFLTALLVSLCSGCSSPDEPVAAHDIQRSLDQTPASSDAAQLAGDDAGVKQPAGEQPSSEPPPVGDEQAADAPMSEPLEAALATFSDDQRAQSNPLAGQEGAAERGGQDFALLCAHCHGESGGGDGAAAQALSIAPSDLKTSQLGAGVRYQIIKDGVAGTAMQSFRAAMSSKQMWQLVAFMDTLRSGTDAGEAKAEAPASGAAADESPAASP